MAGPWEKYGAQTKPANPLLPGQVTGQQLNNTGQALQNQHTAAETARIPLQNTNTQVQTQQTQQQVQFAPGKMGLDIKAQFDSNPYVKAYRDALPNAISAMNAPDNAQGDLAVVYAFGKVMDPGSVVREGELNMANQTSPLVGQLQSYIGMVNAGKRLPKATRTGLIEAIRAKSGEYDRGYTAAREQYIRMAKSAGLNPDDVIGPHDAAPFQGVEKGYIQRATGATKRVTDPKKSAALSSLIRAGVPFEEASQIVGGFGGKLDRKEYDDAVAYAKQHGGVTNAEVGHNEQMSLPQQIVNSLPIGNADIGLVHGAKQAFDRAATGLEAAANVIPGIDSRSAQDASAQSEQMFAGLPGDQTAQTLGRLAASGLLAAPLKAPTLAGAAGNLLMTDSTGIDAAKDAGLGAVGGKIGDVALKGAAQLFAPNLVPSVSNLAQEGARLTPGRFFPSLKKSEDLISSLPVVSGKIDNAMNQASASISRIPLNRSLGRVGQSLPDSVPSGHPATAYTQRTLGDLYDNTLAGTQAMLDPTFVSRMNYLGQRSNLRPQEFEQLADIMQREVGGAFQKGGAPGILSGRDYKLLDGRLGKISTKLQADPSDPFKNELGDSIEQMQEQLRHLYRRQNPAQARTLRDLDTAYADFVPAQRASAMSVEDGIPTPGEYRSAVRQNDSTKRKGATARGEARLQDFAIDASNVVPAARGNPGTADRLNQLSLKAWTLGGLLSPLYSEPALNTLNYLAKRKPDAASKAIAKGLRLLPPSVGGAGFPLLIESGN